MARKVTTQTLLARKEQALQEKQAIEAQLLPLRAERQKLQAQIAPVEEQIRSLLEQERVIRHGADDDLFNLTNEIAMISRALGAYSLSAEGVAPQE